MLTKDELRQFMLMVRQADANPAPILARLGALSLPEIVAGVWPLPGEIDLRPLLDLLHARGHVIVLPETTPHDTPLTYRRWHPDAVMLCGRFATSHPDGPMLKPQLMLVPLLAFDRRCHRLGYGGGYYDRTLAALPGVPAIGYGYATQQVTMVPIGPHDRALDAVVTERELIGSPSAA